MQAYASQQLNRRKRSTHSIASYFFRMPFGGHWIRQRPAAFVLASVTVCCALPLILLTWSYYRKPTPCSNRCQQRVTMPRSSQLCGYVVAVFSQPWRPQTCCLKHLQDLTTLGFADSLYAVHCLHCLLSRKTSAARGVKRRAILMTCGKRL